MFESYWVALSKYEKIMVSFIFCLQKHIFLIIIQIFTESLIFELLVPWTCLTLHFLVFWEIYILITHWWPIIMPKTSNGVEWSWITPHDLIFLKLMKNWWRQQKYHMKGGQTHNIWKQQHNSFPMRGYWSKSGRWRRRKADVSKKFQPYPTDPPRFRNFAKSLGSFLMFSGDKKRQCHKLA